MNSSLLEAVLPLSPLQEGMLFHALYDEQGADAYTLQVAVGLVGKVDPDRLRLACSQLLQRHTALRAGFQQRKSGESVQLVRRTVEVPWAHVDLRAVTPGDQRNLVRQYLAEDHRRRFDLTKPPLIRFTLVSTAEDNHILALTYHHILLDAWSLPLVLNDLFELYARNGDLSAFSPAVSNNGYLSWLSKQDRNAAQNAWRKALAGLDAPTLTAPGAGPSDQMPKLAKHELSEETTTLLNKVAREHGVTMNTVVQGVWALLLSMLSGRTDVVFGQAVSGRAAPVRGIEQMVGLLINTIPVRVRFDPAEPVGDLLTRLQNEQATLSRFQHLGLTEIHRIAGMSQLFDTSLGFRAVESDSDAVVQPVPDLTVTTLTERGDDDRVGAAHYPMSLIAVSGTRLELELSYRSDLFSRDDADRLLVRARLLLETIAIAPQTPVGHIGLLTADELASLWEWNDTDRHVPDDTLVELFEAQAARTPDAEAVTFGGQAMTYAELNEAANRMARVMLERGVEAERFVAVMLPRSFELIVTLLGVLKAGGAYLPIDLAYPAQRVEFMLADASPVVVVSHTSAPPVPGAFVVDTPDARAALDRQLGHDITDAERRYRLSPAHSMYMIYTSGSTGRPKGVLVSHRSVNGYVAFAREAYVGLRERALVHSPVSFDLTVTGIFGTLTAGGCIDLVDLDDSTPLTTQPTFVKATPSHLPLMTNGGNWLSPSKDLIVGGEQLTGEALAPWREKYPNTSVINEYGPTETTVGCMEYWVRPGDTLPPGAVPIGRAVWNMRVYVLDHWLRPVPAGVSGELYIAGSGLARGYLNRPELSAVRFVPDPLGPPGSRMYRTGDVAWWRADGQMVFGGRIDDQVKVRGYRIELGEIQSAIAADPSVSQAVVIVRDDPSGARRLVAYVVGQQVDTAALRDRLTSSLPEYMVPAAFVVLPELPQTPNGKLDTKALPAPESAGATEDREAARNEVEQTLCTLFAEVLGVAEIGIHDDFFDSGGDSIVSIQLVTRARNAGLTFTPKDVFAHRTVAALAASVEPVDQAPVQHSDPGTGDVVLTPIVHWLRDLGGPIDGFNQSTLLKVPAGLGLDHLNTAVRTVVDHHDALRMTLSDDWKLSVAPQGQVQHVTRVEVTGSLADAVAAHSAAAVAELSPRDGRMLRVVWFDAGDQPGRLLVVVHHLAVDGMSWRILLPDLYLAWKAAATGEKATLDPVPTSLRTWAKALTEAAGGLDGDFWTSMDGDEALGTLDPVRDVHGANGHLTLRLTPEETEPLLTTVPAAFRAGVQEVLLTALALAVASWRDRADVLVDVEGHGREDIGGLDLSRTVGWFTSLYPVRLNPGVTRWADGPEIGRALKLVKEQLRAVPEHGIGYGMVRYLNPRTKDAFAGVRPPQIGFNYLGRFSPGKDTSWQVAGEPVAPGVDPAMPVAHVVELNAVTEDLADGPHLTATWSWAKGLLADADVQELSEIWHAAVRALIQTVRRGASGLTPSDVSMVSIGQEELDSLRAHTTPHAVADVLPLSPVQQGLLFHALYDRQSLDVHNVQMVFELTGPLDREALKTACETLVRRHEALRAGFTLLSSGQPVQVIAAEATLPWDEVDLVGTRPAELKKILADDRARPFDMARPPLVRCLLVRVGEARHTLVLTSHHILADGWSTTTMLNDLFQLYVHRGDPTSLPRTAPYRSYLDWLSTRDNSAAEKAWREALEGVTEPTLIAPGTDSAHVSALPERIITELSKDDTNALVEAARRHGVTMNTLVQAAWALTLHSLTGQRDVVFGATVSGRSPDIPGVENIVGLLINTVPVRIRLTEGGLGELVKRVQTEQVALSTHHHLALSSIRRLADVGEVRDLFDTSIVFENYPTGESLPQSPGPLRLTGFSGRDAYHYPLKLMAVPGDRLYLEVSFRPDLLDAEIAARAADQLRAVLDGFAVDSPVVLGETGTPTEDVMARLFAETLDLAAVGPHDDFFHLGGDSLRALELVGRVRAALYTELDVRAVFQRRTVRGLAALCPQSRTDHTTEGA